MADSQFFDESREQSEVKARIVQKYFWAFGSRHHANCPQIRQPDSIHRSLCGSRKVQGRDAFNTSSGLREGIADPNMRSMLVTLFNDKDAITASVLQAAIDALPGIEKLKHKPQVFLRRPMGL